MIFLEYETLEPIDAMLWHAYPKHESIIETYDVGELTVEVLDHPSLRSSIDLAVVAFSLLVFRNNEIIAVFQIEQEDLRSRPSGWGAASASFRMNIGRRGR